MLADGAIILETAGLVGGEFDLGRTASVDTAGAGAKLINHPVVEPVPTGQNDLNLVAFLNANLGLREREVAGREVKCLHLVFVAPHRAVAVGVAVRVAIRVAIRVGCIGVGVLILCRTVAGNVTAGDVGADFSR